ncbi:MAG: hypothetical protein JOZ90_08930 [Alphaproteobacteria bacterium]|nr:hypothetical protein [Alphaproteobacteria bacterium]MBV9371148.1 hypothetical protein [Alphaproteobacteria bacterium]MBV9901207.1 hypothetical protein [Alphaproteobacteria bacterium]
MLPAPAYYTILALCWGYALLRGGPPERIGASIIGIGSILSALALSGSTVRFGSVEVGVFYVDVAALLGFLALALYAERYWPLWVTALQAIGTAGHAVKYVDSHVVRLIYAFALALWAYPMLFLIVLGTWRHQKRVAQFGADRSWSSFSGRLGLKPGPGPTG